MNEQQKKEKIEELIEESLNAYSEESIDECIKILTEAWELLPEDKSLWDEGYMLSKEFIETYYFSGDLNGAESWIDEFLKADTIHRDYGEASFIAGKIKYDLNKLEEAKELFKLADQKSGGRVWKGKDDPKYVLFFKKK